MGCYICGAKEFTKCHHCYMPVCKEHAHFVEEIGAYLCDSCYEEYLNGSPNILSE
ncbi:MAG: hypothetical protein J7K61_03270 [Thermoplasmata archaeon]|nr:hypothetical protein [Thermoplasmata archaeon]